MNETEVDQKQSMLSRALTLDERIKTSCLFPRIRDAEVEMEKNENEFRKKRERERKMREKQHQLDLKVLALKGSPKKIASEPQNHYFTGFVLNKDPACSQYMPFDEIYFPKLFNKETQQAPPETLQNLWMLGFEDHVYRSHQPKTEHANSSIEMDVSVASSPTKRVQPGKQKKNKHKFIAVYSNKPI